MKTNSLLLLFPFFITAIFALPDYEKYWIAFQNVATGKVLDHYAGETIAAYDSDLTNHYHHWGLYEIKYPHFVSNSLNFVIKNRATGKVLDHYAGEKIAAYDADFSSRYHQWEAIPVEGNVYAFLNLQTGKILDHYKGERIEAYGANMYNPYCQWRLIEIKE